MQRYPAWKHAIVAALVCTAVLYALPSFYAKSPTVQVRAFGSAAVKDGEALIKSSEAALTGSGLAYERLVWEEERGTMIAAFRDTESQIAARTVLAEALGNRYVVALNSDSTAPGWLRALGANPIELGLDLRGGIYFLLQGGFAVCRKSPLERDCRRFPEVR